MISAVHINQLKSAPQPLSVAARNAEALFEAKNVAEIRQIEARTRQDIEEKNVQLRQLVGDSYRDLIEGTDKIIDISTRCHSILDNILAIQEGCASLAKSVTATPSNAIDGKENVKRHRELNAVGSRVKYAMDTPEVIWGCLEAGSHLDAARRLLRVHEVQKQLETSFSTIVAAKFPVLSHQWQTVLKFRQHILTGALATLSSQQDLNSRTAADALAALSLLEGYSSSAALKCFLSARQQWVQQQLERSTQGPCRETPGEVLASVARAAQSCIAQVGELFTPQQQPDATQQVGDAGSNSRGSLLQQVLHEDEADVSELFFGSAEGLVMGGSSPEAAQWREQVDVICQQLTPLLQAEVQEACTAWLSEVSSLCHTQGLPLLQLCDDAHSLLQAEAAVHSAIAAWPAAAAAEGSTSTDQDAPAASTPLNARSSARSGTPAVGLDSTPEHKQHTRLSRLATVAVSGGSPPVSPATAGRVPAPAGQGASTWEVTCKAVLGHTVDMWQVLLHVPFLERCKEVIAAALAEACSSLQEPLSAALAAASLHEPESAGQLPPGTWPASAPAAAEGGVLDRSESTWAAGPPSHTYSFSMMEGGTLSGQTAAQNLDQKGSAAFRNQVQAILQAFDTQLHSALVAVLLLTAAPPAGHQQQQPFATANRVSRAYTMNSDLRLPASGTGSPHAAPPALAAAGLGQHCSSAHADAMATAGRQRARELQSFAQHHCLEELHKLAANLEQQLQQPVPALGVAGAACVEQVLLLARLCSALASQSCMLPVVMGAPESWPAAAAAGPGAPPVGLTTSAATLPASLAQGVSALGPAAAALLRMHHPGLAGQPTAVDPSGPSVQLVSLQQQLHDIACSGYSQWATWTSSTLAAEVSKALTGDALLYSSTTPLSWVETKLSTDAAAGTDAANDGLLDLLDGAVASSGDVCFALPACPSPPVLQALSGACWEVRRAGEHSVPTDALQLLLWELHGALLSALQQLLHVPDASCSTNSLQEGSNGNISSSYRTGDGRAHRPLSEKGVLQLLFDQWFLRDVLGGGKPLAAVLTSPLAAAAADQQGGQQLASSTSSITAALEGRKQLVAALEQQLQDLLDPIDWATYEPHLWGNAQRFYTRTVVLLGLLCQLSKPRGDAPGKAPGAAAVDINTLNVLPVVPRFHYLPVSTPSTAAMSKQRSMHLYRYASAAVSAIGMDAVSNLAVGQPREPAGLEWGQAGAHSQQQQQLPLATISVQASDLAAQYMITDLGSSNSKRGVDRGHVAGGAAAAAAAAAASSLHPTADVAAAAGASALSALQAKLQGSSFGAFGSMLGDRAAEVTAMAQNFGDLLPTAGGLGGGLGGLGGGLLSSFARRD